MDGEYQKLRIKRPPPRTLGQTTEGKYWRRFSSPTTIQQIGIVSHISYCPVFPHDYAVTSATRVLVYDGRTHALKKTLARFPDTAYCGTFRSDGKLLVAGCENGSVQVFDLSSRSILRQFKTHKRPTHAVAFSTDKTHVFSGSDDATARLWDLSQGDQVTRFDGHADYVRAAQPVSDVLWATGSYDHTVKLWDTRARAAVMTLEHGAPVESVAALLNGRMAASAGGAAVALWDLAAGGRPLQRLSNHQKTVTSVSAVDVQDAAGATSLRLISSALDGHVKVYDLETCKVAYAFKYPAPVTAAAVSPHLGSMAVGMADRTLVVRTHKQHNGALRPVGASGVRLPKKQRRFAPRLTAASYRFFIRGMNSKPTADDTVVAARRRLQLKAYDRLLKEFRYGAALDEALAHGQVAITLSLVQELAARNGLVPALARRPPASLAKLLLLLNKYVAHPDHARSVLQLVNCLLDVRLEAVVGSAALVALLEDLKGRVGAEVKVQQEMLELGGQVALLLA